MCDFINFKVKLLQVLLFFMN